MNNQHIPLKVTATRFVRAVKIFMTSDVGGRAKFLLFALVALFGGISALNVVNSFVGRHFMTAIAERQTAEFIRQAILYTMAFAASTIVSVIARFSEERLALLWREFLTRRAVGIYMSGGTFYRVGIRGKLAHPDQRIADDINAFTITTLSFVLMLLNSLLTVLTFSGVLWLISPLLFIAAVVYAATGSYLTILLGRPLISLSYDQLDREAAFRSSLIRVRENAESIMLGGGEQRHANLLLRRFDELAMNFRRIIVINRNVGFFTTGYNWMTQIIPILIIAPVFIRGDMEFGVITQSAAAFAMLVGAFSFIVSQFKSISNFAVVVARISSLIEAIEDASQPTKTNLEIVEHDGHLAYDHVTLTSATGHALLKDLSATFPADARVVVVGDDNAAATALFRATAGIGISGEGRIIRPARDQLRFLAQRTHLALGTLRQILVPSGRSSDVTDEQILSLLKRLGFAPVLETDDLDKEDDWSTRLSPRDQQIVAIAGVLIAAPSHVFFENADVIFGHDQLRDILALLAERKIACVNLAEADTQREAYDAVLECHADGSWNWIDQRGRS
ncbi:MULTISPECIES: SbmA/BacA-like family transporter [unclassified Rhizobium]|uniref:ABC transporter ATP-binding protein/permease n=1 Tax=unclassified Rhizobium TaxID=2613769 RepID=UPI000CDF42B9|nr:MULTISPECIES: SbmA/BacA-like family transporter [Rhizobium]AVA26363.1 ABC transporter ATP-binding/permease protein [Rhizobium sp. NXC24]UWU24018.1 ABC transporter ATP-binding protein/permease [Rhizobium tropici]